MPRSKNRWLAASDWHQIMIVDATGNVHVLRPDTQVYITGKKILKIVTIQDLLQDLFQISVNAGEEDPWQHAVRCISSLAVMKQMKIHDPQTGKVVGKASLTPPRSMMN